MKTKYIEVPLFRNEYTRTIICIHANGDIAFVRHESSSDDQIFVKSKDRKQLCASLVNQSAQSHSDVIESNEYLLTEIQSMFGGSSSDPFDAIQSFLKDSGVNFEFSIWSNR